MRNAGKTKELTANQTNVKNNSYMKNPIKGFTIFKFIAHLINSFFCHLFKLIHH